MLPESPVRAKQKQAGFALGALTSCGIAAWALLTGPPVHVPAVLALACVMLGNAAIVYVAWPDTDGFLIRVRGRRKRGRRDGGPPGRPGTRSVVTCGPLPR